MSRLLVLRPEPGASATCRRALARGLEATAAPLFVVRPVAWTLPDIAFDAVLLTSANAARHGGEALRSLALLPAYAVGEATARAAREAGFADVRSAAADGAAALARLEADGRRHVLHLVGREHVALDSEQMRIERRVVYAADAVDALPPLALGAVAGKAVILLHSPRAGALFRELLDEAGTASSTVAIAALSPAVVAAAGPGWRAVAVAATPDDDALLAAAAGLCDSSATP